MGGQVGALSSTSQMHFWLRRDLPGDRGVAGASLPRARRRVGWGLQLPAPDLRLPWQLELPCGSGVVLDAQPGVYFLSPPNILTKSLYA